MGLIYKVTNLINGKIYVGKTIFSLLKRRDKHLATLKIDKMLFHRAIAKYGQDNFLWEVLEHIDDNSELSKTEIAWIAKLHTNKKSIGYNRTIGGDGALHCEKDSAETRIKKSIGMLGNKNRKGKGAYSPTKSHRDAISKAMVGIKRSPMSKETKELISAKMRGRTLSETHKKKLSISVRKWAASKANRRVSLGDTHIPHRPPTELGRRICRPQESADTTALPT